MATACQETILPASVRKCPELKHNHRVAHDGDGGVVLEVFSDAYLDDNTPMRFRRCSGRWRRGNYVSGHVIASRIFDYESPPTSGEIEYMSSFVDGIGETMDAWETARSDWFETRENVRYANERLFEKMRLKEAEKLAEELRTPAEPRHLYLMRHKNGLTKIGVSNNPRAREKTLQAEDPRLRLLFSFNGAADLEYRLHSIFKPVRVRGEWFRLQKHHVRWIRAIALNYSSKDQKEAM